MTGGSSHRRMAGWTLAAVLTLSAHPAIRLSAQADTVAADTSRHMKPLAAFWRSLLIPGWGQAATGRHVTGGIFVAWEGVTMMMTLKAQDEVRYLQSIGSGHVDSKRQEVEDWLVLWFFNHLFAGAEAYVSAHLQDFPADLQIRAFPSGIGVTMPLPRF